MNYHPADSKQWSLFTKHLAIEFTVEGHCGSWQRSTCSVQKKKNQKTIKVYRKRFALNKGMPHDPEPQLSDNSAHTGKAVSVWPRCCNSFFGIYCWPPLLTISGAAWTFGLSAAICTLCTLHKTLPLGQYHVIRAPSLHVTQSCYQPCNACNDAIYKAESNFFKKHKRKLVIILNY